MKRVVPILLLAVACADRQPATGPDASFTLAVAPPSLTLSPGASGMVTVTATRAGGFTGAIAVAFDGLPAGVAADTPPIAAGADATVLTLRNMRIGNPVNGVRVSVRGTAAGRSASASFDISVQCPATPAAELTILAGAPGGAGIADDTGADARFDEPESLVGDGAGNLYVADTFNNAIRKISLPSGEVTTIAAAAAGFVTPFGITRAGDFLYVTDTFNHTIRRIDPASGAVTTIAGKAGEPGSADGAPADARFDEPGGIASDGESLFVADNANDTIRRIDLASGLVSTVAGSPGQAGSDDGICDLARFKGPTGVAADGAGNLFVADTGNDTIRKIVLATEVVSTFAGAAGQAGAAGGIGGEARFDEPSGLAVDGAGGLYVADIGNQLIRFVDLASGDVTGVAGAPSPMCKFEDPNRLCFPRGVAVERGVVYVADTGADVIRALATDGLHVVAGGSPHPALTDGIGGAARFRFPFLLAGDGADIVYVADSGADAVRRVSVSTGQVSQVARLPAGFEGVSGVALDGDALYVTNTFESVIEKVTLADGRFSIVAGTAGAAGSGDGVGVDAQFMAPTGIVSDGHGSLYVADESAIRRIDLGSFAVTTLPVTFALDDDPDSQTAFSRPTGLAFDGAGNLYVADTSNHVIRRVDLASSVVSTVAGKTTLAGAADGTAGEARFNSPQGLALDGGILYVADSGNGLVRTIDLASRAVETVLGQPGVQGVKAGPLPARLNQPAGLALFGGGRLVISDRPENVLLLARFSQ